MTGDIALTAAARVLTTAAGAAAAIITARALGVEDRGEYFYVVTVALLAVQIANLGLPVSNTYLAARDQALVTPLFVNSFWIALLLGPAAVAVIAGIVAAIPGPPTRPSTHLVWAALIAPCSLFYLLSSNLLIAIGRFRPYNAIAIGASALQLILMLVAAVLWPTINGFLAISLLSIFVYCATVTWVLTKKQSRPRSMGPSLRLLEYGISYAIRSYFILLFQYVLSRMPILVLWLRGDTHSLGIMSVVVQFVDLLIIIPSSVALVMFPKLASKPDRNGGKQALRATIGVAAIMSAICAILALVATPLIASLFGEPFSPSAEALRLMLPGVVLLSTANILGQYVAAAGNPVTALLAWGAAVCIGFWLSPSEGGAEAAVNAAVALSWSYAALVLGIGAVFVKEFIKAGKGSPT